jgi:hypothetical protein
MYFFSRFTGHPHLPQALPSKCGQAWQMAYRRSISASLAIGIPAAMCWADAVAKFLAFSSHERALSIRRVCKLCLLVQMRDTGPYAFGHLYPHSVHLRVSADPTKVQYWLMAKAGRSTQRQMKTKRQNLAERIDLVD